MTVSRSTPAGAAYLDLRNKAKADKRPFEELLALHVLDGFLARLSASSQKDRLLLKGGVLLAAFDLRRPTRDVDLMAHDLDNDAENVLGVVQDIAKSTLADGVVFDFADATAELIRDDDEYSGIRVNMTAHVATANVTFHVDVNIGDPVSPAPQDIVLPRVLGDSIELRGYPMAMVHAEKIVTALSRGTANTRWRDFGDIYALAGLTPSTATNCSSRSGQWLGTAGWIWRPSRRCWTGMPPLPRVDTPHGFAGRDVKTCLDSLRTSSTACSHSPTRF